MAGSKVTAGAISPHLRQGIGIALMDATDLVAGTTVTIQCIDGESYPGELLDMPFYDRNAEIPRDKCVDIPA